MTKTILLTGACGGIGHAVARLLDQHEHHLLLLDSDTLALEAVDATLHAEHTLVPFDLWRNGYDAYQTLAHLIAEDHGKLDAVIHCAAACGNLRPLIHCDPESWLCGLQVNLTAPLWLFQTQLKLLQQSQAPRVIFSLHRSHSDQPAYWHSFGASQAALENLIVSLYDEKNAYPEIGFATVDPGWVDTPQSRAIFPAGKHQWKQADAVAPLYLQALESNRQSLEHYS